MIDTKDLIGFLLNTKIISDSRFETFYGARCLPRKSDMYSADEIVEYRLETIKRLEDYERIKMEMIKLIGNLSEIHKIEKRNSKKGDEK